MDTTAPVIFATRSGGTTLDRDAQGGNPFASALIDLAEQEHTDLGTFAALLRAATESRSHGVQSPEWLALPDRSPWSLHRSPFDPPESRTALLILVSAYPADALPPLYGAAWDERRVAAALARNGFSVTQGVRGDRTSLLKSLRAFGVASRRSESAVIYATGHGIEHAGETWLIPTDYPFEHGYTAGNLRRHAIPVARIRQACTARNTRLVFFAGCRSPGDAVGHARESGTD